MDLVTVTCNRDYKHMVLQAESIQMHLEPCVHWVIVNELNPDKNFWKNSLQPFYTKHKLNLIFPEYFPTGRGWIRQQMYKFWIHKFIKDDYLILDSKNFFIRPCSLSLWDNFLDEINVVLLNKGDKFDDGLFELSSLYSNYLKIPEVRRTIRIHTPFVFKSMILDTIPNFDNFLEWFSDTVVFLKDDPSAFQSEFFLYSMLVEHLGLLDKNFKKRKHWAYHDLCLWPNNKEKLYPYLDNIHRIDTIRIAGFHPRAITNELSDADINFINTWLFSMNFQSTLDKIPEFEIFDRI